MIIHDFRTKLFLGTLNLQTYLYSALKDTLSVKEKAIMRYIIKLKEDIEKNTDTMKHHICVNENDQCVYLIGFL